MQKRGGARAFPLKSFEDERAYPAVKRYTEDGTYYLYQQQPKRGGGRRFASYHKPLIASYLRFTNFHCYRFTNVPFVREKLNQWLS